jgi:hypothetical protein
MVGAALAINKDAMDSAGRILDCPRCLATPAAQMVVIAICDRLITWSQATAASLMDSGSNMKSEAIPLPSGLGLALAGARRHWEAAAVTAAAT